MRFSVALVAALFSTTTFVAAMPTPRNGVLAARVDYCPPTSESNSKKGYRIGELHKMMTQPKIQLHNLEVSLYYLGQQPDSSDVQARRADLQRQYDSYAAFITQCQNELDSIVCDPIA